MLRRLLASRVAAIVACVALVAVIAFELVRLTEDDSLPRGTAASRSVARDMAVALTSFDHERIDADLERVLALGSPAFERQFRTAMGPSFLEGVTSRRTVSSGRVVVGPTIQRVGSGAATYLVVVNQQIVSEGSDEPARESRVAMLVRVSTAGNPKVQHVEVI